MQKIKAMLEKHPRWLALLAGGASATGFAPLNLWLLTLLCLALFMHLIASAGSGKRALLIGWLFGVGHFTIGNNWIATAFTYQAAMPAWLGWIAVVLLALYLAVYPALAAWGAWWVGKCAVIYSSRHPVPDTGSRFFSGFSRRLVKSGTPHQVRGDEETETATQTGVTIPLILAFAGCWIITEWLRSWVFTGFAWNPLGAIMLRDHFAPPFIRWIGTYGLSGWVILTVGIFIWTWQYLRYCHPKLKNAGVGPAFVAWCFLPAIWLGPQSLLDKFSDNDFSGRQNASLTIVQPNISQIDKYTQGYEAMNFARLARHSRPLTDQPRLLLWPEAAIPWWLEDGYPPHVYLNQPGGSAASTRNALARLLGPDDILLTGGDRLEFDAKGTVVGARNSVMAIDATGDIKARYNKAHLVPYGEYLALRWLLEPLGATRLVPGDLDFWPGPGPRTLNIGKGKPKVGMQICYEIIFSGQVVDRANRPDFIFNPSNDAWFGSWGPPQHLAQARLRAIEEGLPVVRSTPTGISALIDADGRVLESLAPGKAGRIDARLPAPKAPTLFARHGNILPLGFAAMLIILAFLPLVRRRISR